ncbi:MAG: 30S ribosomal protein S8 [Bacillota bacterium]
MTLTDPIADMLTRIRNGLTAKHETVDVPASKMKVALAEILVSEGYIKSATVVEVENSVQNTIHIELKYTASKEKAIRGIKRISKPGLRVYAKSTELPRVLDGMGIAIISTSKGIMTDKQARAIGAGGEVIAFVW